MEEYLLKVGAPAAKGVAKLLELSKAPAYIRVATMAPLSAYGYPPGSEGAVLRIDGHGLLVGVEGDEDIPRDFVPWHNVTYVADGTIVAKERTEGAGA